VALHYQTMFWAHDFCALHSFTAPHDRPIIWVYDWRACRLSIEACWRWQFMAHFDKFCDDLRSLQSALWYCASILDWFVELIFSPDRV